MGAKVAKHTLFLAINADDRIKIKQILQKFPNIINEPITDDGRTNAVSHAAY